MSDLPLDFPPPPAAPTIGQIFPGPNGVIWTWDGQKWTAGAGIGGGTGGGGIPEAPQDGNTYGRNDANWVQVLALTGGTMTGAIMLPSAAPTSPFQAVTKQYVDELAGIGGLYLGTWQVAANTPNISLGGTVDSQNYIAITANPNVAEQAPTGIPGIGGTMISNGDRIVWTTALNIWQRVPGDSLDLQAGDARYLQLAGGTMTGDEYLANGVLLGFEDTQGTPSTIQIQSNNTLVWNVTNSGGGPEMMFSVPVHADDTMLTVGLDTSFSGAVWLSSDPVALMQAATKQYVDSHIAAVAGGLQFVGTINGATGQCAFTAASGISPNPGALPPASAYPNTFVVCDNPGTVPSGPANGIQLSAGDWLVSDGVFWNHIAIGSAGILAQDVAVTPSVLGATNVQQALTNLSTNYLPLAGGTLSGNLFLASPNKLVVGGGSAPSTGPGQIISPYISSTWNGFNAYISSTSPLQASYLANGFAANLSQDTSGNLNISTAPTGVGGTPVTWGLNAQFTPGGNSVFGGNRNINYPVQIAVGPTGNANIVMTVAGVRQWVCGVNADGSFKITDVNAGTDRIAIGTTGNLNLYGPGIVYNFYDDNVFAFLWDGQFVQIIVDGSSQGQYAPLGFNDARYVAAAGGTYSAPFQLGTLGVSGDAGIDGSLTVIGTIYGTVSPPSDEALKENILPSGAFDSLSAIRALRSMSFNWKNGGQYQPFGLIASNVKEVLPDVVRRNRDLDHLDLTALLVHSLRAIQQLAEKIGA